VIWPLAIKFLVLAIGAYLAVGLIGGLLWHFPSGWERLQETFPDRKEPALSTLRFRSGRLGDGWKLGVNYLPVLCFDNCNSGLRVRMLPVFALLSKPFFVPWSSLEIEESAGFGVNLYFGKPMVGTLVVSQAVARQVRRFMQRA
jgi:hypothetical protein